MAERATEKVTLATIAAAVGVSRMTVSNAFSRPDQLSVALREEILSTAATLGYAGPDPVARAQAVGRTGTVGVLFSDRLGYAFTDEVATGFLAGVAEELDTARLALTVLASPRDDSQAGAVGTAMIDGLLAYSTDVDSPGLVVARQRRLPLVFVDLAPEAGVGAVVVDDRGGARRATAHLRRLGHRSVALVADGMAGPIGVVPSDTGSAHYVVAERLAGWRAGLGVRAARSATLVNASHNDRAAGRAAAAAALDQSSPDRPTAFCCMSDVLALGVVDEVTARGLRVPEDISVVGFDDAAFASVCVPPLTTVRQPVRAKGRAAAALLLELLGERPSADPSDPAGAPGVQPPEADGVVRLATQLVVRSSTASPPEDAR